MTDKGSSMEHANSTNPCQGVCQVDEDFCVACFRTSDERANWYKESNEWRDNVLVEIKNREDKMFNEN